MKRSDRERLLDALGHLAVLRQHLTRSDLREQIVLDAAVLRLSSAIESLSHVSDSLRRQTIPDELWRKIKGTRNLIAHEYGFLHEAQLREIFEGDATTLEADIRRMLEQAAG